MNDLQRYRTVSALPAPTRDISVAISVDDDAEQVGDQIRTALAERAEVLEGVAILSQTDYLDLPASARSRLGMNEAQRNVLVRLVLRPVDRTLTDAEANALRDEVYEAIHQGSRGQWAAPSHEPARTATAATTTISGTATKATAVRSQKAGATSWATVPQEPTTSP